MRKHFWVGSVPKFYFSAWVEICRQTGVLCSNSEKEIHTTQLNLQASELYSWDISVQYFNIHNVWVGLWEITFIDSLLATFLLLSLVSGMCTGAVNVVVYSVYILLMEEE